MLSAERKDGQSPTGVVRSAGRSRDWRRIAEPWEGFLGSVADRLAAQVEEFLPDLATLAAYALSVQGKQLRPLLVGLGAGATGGVKDGHVSVAVIIEMVHLATLVHDDVMDGALVRRGRPTLAANWGHEIAVLLGDCLFAHSLKMAAGFPTPEVCRAVASATNTVCGGEILQTQRRRRTDLSRAEYFQMLAMKTGELFALACDLGAFLNGAPPAQRTALRDFGLALGTAYQLYDDCLDLFGDESAAGKSLGTDLARGKLTLPLLVVMEQADPETRRQFTAMVSNWNPADLPTVKGWLRQYNAFAEARQAMSQYLHSACRSLDFLPDSTAREALLDLTGFLRAQTESLGSGT